MSNKAEAPKGSSWPMETILLSICLEHGKMFEEILSKIKAEKARDYPRSLRS
jgi:hypothetical protein